MKQVQDFLDKEIAMCESSLKFAENDKEYDEIETRRKTLQEVLRTLNGSAPELHVCPDCAADLAYVKGGQFNGNPGFELVHIRHNC